MTSQEIITQLDAEVEAAVTVETSAGVLIQGLSDALKAATSDPAAPDVDAIKVIIAKLDASKEDLAAKVAANTIAGQATTATPAADASTTPQPAVDGAQAGEGFKTTQA